MVKRSYICVIACLLLVGCAEDKAVHSLPDGSVPDADTISSPDSIPLESWRAELLLAQCTSSCTTMHEFGAANVEECIAKLPTTRLGQTLLFEFTEALAGIEAGRITYDADAAKLCVEQIAGYQCEEQIEKKNFSLFKISNFIACRDVFTGHIEANEDCYSVWDCVGGDYDSLCVQDKSDSCVGTCIALGREGSACDAASPQLECADDFYCDVLTSACHERLADGQACTAPPEERLGFRTQPCLPGHLCLDGVCGTPEAKVTANAACWIDQQCPLNHSCERDVENLEWQCQEFLSNGSICNPGFAIGAECIEGSICDNSSSTCIVGTDIIPIDGDCSEYFCDGEDLTSFCDFESEIPTCRLLKARDLACLGSFECQLGLYCDETSVCAPALPGGAVCERAETCESASCVEGQCEASAVECIAPTT